MNLKEKMLKGQGKAAASLPSKKSWITPDNRYFDGFSITIILVGVIMFMLGMGIDMSVSKYPDLTKLFSACKLIADASCEKELNSFTLAAHSKSNFDWIVLAGETLKAVGLTIVAAVAISSTVDHRTREYFFEQLSNKTEQLGSNVITGMFESNHPDRLFEIIRTNILQKKIIRRSIDVNYTLSDLSFDDPTHSLYGKKFLRVDVILSTITENVSLDLGAKGGIVEVPLGLALPSPMYDELKPFVRINGFRIGDDEIAVGDIDKINVKLQESLKDDNAVDAKVDISKFEIPFAGSITCSGSYTMVKEIDDTEVFRTAEIAENIHLTVVDKSSHNLIIQARSMSQGKLHNQKSPTAQQWKLDDLSLPLQGIMVWWKQPVSRPDPLKSRNSDPNRDNTPKRSSKT